jgi:hypothetical protein
MHRNYLRHDVEHYRCDGIHERLPDFIDSAVGRAIMNESPNCPASPARRLMIEATYSF